MDIATYRLSVCHTLFSITKLVIPWFWPCVSCFESYTHMHMNVVSSFQCVYLPPTSVCSASSKKAFASEANTREHKRTVIRKHFSAVFKCSRQFNSEKKNNWHKLFSSLYLLEWRTMLQVRSLKRKVISKECFQLFQNFN